MLSTMLSNRAKTLLVLGMVLAGLVLPLRAIAAEHLINTIDANFDLREALKGSWECQGTSTLGQQGVQPYAGRLDNHWVPGRPWLVLEFEEQRSEGKPFREQQLWEVLADGTHRRTIITEDGTWGIVTSPRLRGHASRWEGPFGTAFLSEKLTLRSADEHHWYGAVANGGYYELTCRRLPSR